MSEVSSPISQASDTSVTDSLRRRWYVPLALVAAGFVATDLPWNDQAASRVLVAAVSAAWLAIFFPSNSRSRVAAGGAAAGAVLGAALGAPGTWSFFALLAVIWAAMPEVEAPAKRGLGLGIAALGVYTAALATGGFLLLDDLIFRPWMRAAASLGLRLMGRPGGTAEAPSLQSVVGPWLLLWSSLVVAGAWGRFASGARGRVLVRTVLAWLIPTGLALLLISPWPLILATASMAPRPEPEETPTKVRMSRLRWLSVACLGAFVLIQAGLAIGAGSVKPKTVALAPVGLGTAEVPKGSPTNPKAEYEAFFGRLPVFLENQGIQVKRLTNDWKAADLAGVDTALFINQNRMPTADQVEGVYREVERGMRLVVSGDHTDIMGVRGPSNRYLSRVPIQLRFDSAIPFVDNREWHAATWRDPRLGSAREFGMTSHVSVGASLLAGPLARPLLVGVKGFADAGDLKQKPGGLGNMKYDPGEPVFGIPLVAEASYGQGTVLAFGDTSTFQDGSITEAGRFLLRSLARPATSPAVAVVLGWVGLGLLGTALLTATTSPMRMVATLLVAGAALAGPAAVSPRTGPEISLRNNVVFERGLRPRYPGFFENEKNDRLGEMVWRHGVQMLEGDITDAVSQGADCILIQAPTRAPRGPEIAALKDFVQEGGNVMVMSGRRSLQATRDLLAAFGLSILPVPLGGGGTTAIVDPHLLTRAGMLNGIPLRENNPLMLDACEIRGPGRVLTRTMGKPTSVLVRAGKGQILVVGDDTFGTSKTLGQQLNVNLNACRLLHEMVGLVKSRGR